MADEPQLEQAIRCLRNTMITKLHDVHTALDEVRFGDRGAHGERSHDLARMGKVRLEQTAGVYAHVIELLGELMLNNGIPDRRR